MILEKIYIPTKRERYRQAIEFLTPAQVRDIRLAMNDAWDRRLADDQIMSDTIRLLAQRYGVKYGTVIKAAYMPRP